MTDDPREQAPDADLDEDQMEQGETAADDKLGFAPQAPVKPKPGSTIQGSGDR